VRSAVSESSVSQEADKRITTWKRLVGGVIAAAVSLIPSLAQQ
jgi:hypothetical protein